VTAWAAWEDTHFFNLLRNTMIIHELKTDPLMYQVVWEGRKQFEVRRDDRGYQIGDTLYLRETTHTGSEMRNGAPLVYTGRETSHGVGYILRGPSYGLEKGWAILGFTASA
jgi:hypothetical protein